MAFKIFLGLLVVIAAVLWLRHSYIQESHSASVTVPTVGLSKPVTFTSDDKYVELSGTAIMDTSSGIPAVPYIKYQDSKQGMVTKQLIFADSRGCLPNAGDIPCVPSYAPESPYPSLTTGQAIQVKGYIRADRLIVVEISTTP